MYWWLTRIFYKELYVKRIVRIRDIVDDVGQLLKAYDLKTKYDLSLNVLSIQDLLLAIPFKRKYVMNENVNLIEQNILEDNIVLTTKTTSFSMNNIKHFIGDLSTK